MGLITAFFLRCWLSCPAAGFLTSLISVVPDLLPHLPSVFMLNTAPEKPVWLPAQLRLNFAPWMQSDSSCHRQHYLVTQAGSFSAWDSLSED